MYCVLIIARLASLSILIEQLAKGDIEHQIWLEVLNMGSIFVIETRRPVSRLRFVRLGTWNRNFCEGIYKKTHTIIYNGEIKPSHTI